MRRRADALRVTGDRIAVVPTMGALHAGHLSLIRIAAEQADHIVATIFVNPTQFGPAEDLDTYPRRNKEDVAAAEAAGATIAFCPSSDEMYSDSYQTYVEVRELTRPLCGATRAGHFAGVTTVVAKLFGCTKPHVAIFGEKDYQQLVVIRQMVHDLDFGIEIIGAPIVREEDGLALSSRNTHLSAKERNSALGLSRALEAGGQLFAAGERRVQTLLDAARTELAKYERVRPDYVELLDAVTLKSVETVEDPAVLAIAAFVGETRLIDNCVLGR